MTNRKFERAARINKTKAILLTLSLHIVLIGGFSMYGEGSAADLVPEKIKDFLGWQDDSAAAQNSKDEVALRP